jgi:hypothetical protein
VDVNVTKVYSSIPSKIYLKSKQSIKIPVQIETNMPTNILVKSSTKNVTVSTKNITAISDKVYNIKVKAVKVSNGTKKAKLTITAGSKVLKLTINIKKSYPKVKKITVKYTKKLKKSMQYQIVVKTVKGLYSVPTFKLSKTAKKYISVDKAGKVVAKNKTAKKGKNKYVNITIKQGNATKTIQLRVV